MGKMEETHDLGRLLQEAGLISEEQLRAARQAQAAQEKSVGRVLVDMGLITEEAKIAFLHKRLGYEIVDVSGMAVPQDILTRIARSYVEKHRCVPILIEDKQIIMAMEDPTDIVVLDEIERQAGMSVVPVLARLADIEGILAQYPQVTQEQADKIRDRLQTSRVWRILHPILFVAVMILPIAGFFLASKFSETFGTFVLKYGSPFDIALYGIISWIVWTLLVWEVDALAFSKSEE